MRYEEKNLQFFAFQLEGRISRKGDERESEYEEIRRWPRRDERFRSDNRPLHASGLDFDRTGGEMKDRRFSG